MAEQRWVPEEWNRRVTALMNAGLAYADAASWADDPLHTSPEQIAAIARDFLDHGFTAAEALRWRVSLYSAETAAEWASRGWTPDTTLALHGALLAIMNEPPADALNEWRDLNLPPVRTLLYVRAGCSRAETTTLEARRQGGEDIDASLRMVVALRG